MVTTHPTTLRLHQAEPGTDTGAAIRLKGVTKSFQRRTGRGSSQRLTVLDDLSLDIEAGQFVSIVGRSGCGKTTLLRLVAGLERVDSGVVIVNGRAVTKPGPDRPMVFQSFALLPWATVVDNVAFGLKVAGMATSQRLQIAHYWLDTVGLSDFAHVIPRELSGGMQQRVGLARALAVDPTFLLMDEPFGALDEITKREMQDELLRVWEGSKKTVLFVTHSVDEAVHLSDRIIVLGLNPQGIVADIKVDMPRPRTRDIESSPRSLEIRAEMWSALGL
jgi:NitT/TauT family transport system ATP-binding protein